MNRVLTRFKQTGFTIVEILIVIAVIGVLATIVVVAYSGIQASARDKSLLSDLDALDGIETRCGLNKTACGITATDAAKAWYSGTGADSYLQFTPSNGNVIDVVVNGTDYCIRGYNPSSTKDSITNAAIKESTDGICAVLAPSVAAGGVFSAPSTFTLVRVSNYIQLTATWSPVTSAYSYTLQYATNPGFSPSTLVHNITGTSRTFIPAPATGSQLYYARVYAVDVIDAVSDPSPTATATTGTVLPP